MLDNAAYSHARVGENTHGDRKYFNTKVTVSITCIPANQWRFP
jgi:hypothetical protein